MPKRRSPHSCFLQYENYLNRAPKSPLFGGAAWPRELGTNASTAQDIGTALILSFTGVFHCSHQPHHRHYPFHLDYCPFSFYKIRTDNASFAATTFVMRYWSWLFLPLLLPSYGHCPQPRSFIFVVDTILSCKVQCREAVKLIGTRKSERCGEICVCMHMLCTVWEGISLNQ